MTATPTRRERQRQATFDEIVEVSRGLLRAGEDVSIRAVAHAMGLTPPALYRYVDSHTELMTILARSVFDDVIATMTVARDGYPPDDPAARIVAAVAAFRRWALGNREEFRLVFASPEDLGAPAAEAAVTITSLDSCAPDEGGADRFAAFFSDAFGHLWTTYRFAIPSDDELDPDLVAALRAQIVPPTDAQGAPEVTPGMFWTFERAWARIYGTVTLEVFGHIHPAFIESGALFAATVLDIGRELGLEPEWPRLRVILRTG